MSSKKWYQKNVLSQEELEQWYPMFLEVEHEYQIVRLSEDGEIDYEATEARIAALMPGVQLTGDFCEKCKSILENWPGHICNDELSSPSRDQAERTSITGDLQVVSEGHSTFTFAYHESIDLLEASGRRGCKLCRLLLQAIRERDLLHVFRVIESRLRELRKSAPLTLLINLWPDRPNPKAALEQLWLLFPGKSKSVHLRPVHISIYGLAQRGFDFHQNAAQNDPATVQAVTELAKHWLQSCQKNHDLCNRIYDAPAPTRLLFISGDFEKVQLVHTAGMDMERRYATLSHCWGNDQSRAIRLTRTSMGVLETGISTKLLSKTCQDAIEIALGAGLNYLWIDSLCIVQGDHGDWEAEASKMASVYGASALNIAASSAVDGSQGCFLKSSSFFGGFEAHLGQGAGQTPCQFRTADVYRKAVSESHLATRAWALQEKVLAPRTLHCGDQGFFWECRSVIASEFLPSGFVQVHVGDELLVCDPLRRKTLERSWWSLRNLYSECRLTYPADKLVALSAIAREVQRERKDQYLAGLWKVFLEEQLCWSIYGARPRPPYRAPSWSWASVDGPLWFSQLYERFYARVEDVQVELAGSDPFGAVRSGEITLRYSVMATGVVSSVRIRGRTQQSWGIPYRNMLGSIDNDTSEHIGRNFYVRPDSMDTNDYIPEQPLFLLPIMGGKTSNTHTTKNSNGAETRIDDMNITGIALQLLDPSKRLYTRIGSFAFKLNGSGDDYHPFLDVLEKTGAAVAEAACSEIVESADEKYLIKIV